MLQFSTGNIGSNVALPRPLLNFAVIVLGMTEKRKCDWDVFPVLKVELNELTNNDIEPAPGRVTGTPSMCVVNGTSSAKSGSSEKTWCFQISINN